MLLFDEASEAMHAQVVAHRRYTEQRDVTVMIPGTNIQVLNLVAEQGGKRFRMHAFDFEQGKTLDAQIPADMTLEVIQ